MAPDERTEGRGSRGALAAWLPSAITFALLAGAAAEVRARGTAVETASYHEQVRRLAAVSIPYSIGDWIARKIDPLPAAVEMLHPNVMVNYVYTNLKTGEFATFLLVQCSDARDLIGHFPPVCYPANGRVSKSAAAKDWQVGGEKILGMRYEFAGKDLETPAGIVVDNFMVLPDGSYGRDMDAVTRVAQNTGLRHFGAGQVQVLTSGAMSDQRRDEVFKEILQPIVPLLESMVSDGSQR